MGGGAWPFLVRGVICLVYSDNERDLFQLTSFLYFDMASFLEGQLMFSQRKGGNNRSVIPLDVLGRTRATLIKAASARAERFWKPGNFIVLGIEHCNYCSSTRNS